MLYILVAFVAGWLAFDAVDIMITNGDPYSALWKSCLALIIYIIGVILERYLPEWYKRRFGKLKHN